MSLPFKFFGKSLAGLALCAMLATPVLAFDGRVFPDATGRDVAVPVDPARVFAAGPPAAVLLYALKPEALVGWVRAPKEADLPWLRPEVRNLPELGRLTGRGDTLNLEVLLTAKPDLIVDFGTVNPTYADLAARVQEQAGLPYALVDGAFATMPAGIRQMADLLAVPERGEALALYAEDLLARIDATLAEIPASERPRVYLARGSEGLETPARGSLNAEIIERVGAVNVVEAETRGLATVSPEQVLAWAPDMIVTIDRDFAGTVAHKPEWQGVPAVRNGQVHLAPSSPFGFIDAPPSVNRLAGLVWLMHRLYPGRFAGDEAAEITAFYTLFYGVTTEHAAIQALLGD